MNVFKNFICIFLVFIICFSICACTKDFGELPVTFSESDESQMETADISKPASKVNSSASTGGTSAESKSDKEDSSTKNQYLKPTAGTTKTKPAPTYASDISGYVTKPDKQITPPDTEPKTVYVLSDVKSNVKGCLEIAGIELTVSSYSGTMLYVNYTYTPDEIFYMSSDFTLQKQVDGQWTDMVQIRTVNPGKTATLNYDAKHSIPEYYHLDKYMNNPENGRYRLKPFIGKNFELTELSGFEIEFTVTKQTVKKASLLQKVENPVAANFGFASYSTNYTYSLLDSRQLARIATLYNNLRFTPIAIPETVYTDYTLTIIDGNGYEHSLVLCNKGIVALQTGTGNYYFVENGEELYEYFDSILLNE
ncbi:MAG: hypothetical protein IKU08_00435 [Clostridia bacterium]|nr:hypothetical protein [Clostridia bacterium]